MLSLCRLTQHVKSLPQSRLNHVVAGANYTLPIPDTVRKIALGCNLRPLASTAHAPAIARLRIPPFKTSPRLLRLVS